MTVRAGPATVIDAGVRLGLDGIEHGYQQTGVVPVLLAVQREQAS